MYLFKRRIHSLAAAAKGTMSPMTAAKATVVLVVAEATAEAAALAEAAVEPRRNLMRPLRIPVSSRPGRNPHPDVSQDAWYYTSVKYVSSNGIMNGFADGTFAPITGSPVPSWLSCSTIWRDSLTLPVSPSPIPRPAPGMTVLSDGHGCGDSYRLCRRFRSS